MVRLARGLSRSGKTDLRQAWRAGQDAAASTMQSDAAGYFIATGPIQHRMRWCSPRRI